MTLTSIYLFSNICVQFYILGKPFARSFSIVFDVTTTYAESEKEENLSKIKQENVGVKESESKKIEKEMEKEKKREKSQKKKTKENNKKASPKVFFFLTS